jgi:hypothetical protein
MRMYEEFQLNRNQKRCAAEILRPASDVRLWAPAYGLKSRRCTSLRFDNSWITAGGSFR